MRGADLDVLHFPRQNKRQRLSKKEIVALTTIATVFWTPPAIQLPGHANVDSMPSVPFCESTLAGAFLLAVHLAVE